MEYRVNRFSPEFSVNPEGRNKSQTEKQETKLTKSPKEQRFFDVYDTSSRDIMANYGKADIRINRGRQNLPDGLSEYRYKDSQYKIYRHGDRYRSEFIGRHGVDKAEFFSHFEELKPQKRSFNDYSSSTTITDVNGAIDGQVLQGNTGDCWLLTALEAMSSTQAGRDIISNSITVNDNNTVTVSFKGLGVSYTLTSDEIARHDTDNNLADSYSNGDNDALVMELAVEKLWKDINSGKVRLNTSNEDITYTDRSIDGGGLPVQMIYYLTGIEANEYYNDDLSSLSKNTVYQVLQEALENGNTAINFGIYYNEHSAKLIDGSTYSIDVEDGGHALAVTNITSNTVTFVNPWDSNEEYTMSWSEFASLGIGYMSSADLTQTNFAPESQDTEDNSEYVDNNDYEWHEIPDDYGSFDDFAPTDYYEDDFRPSPFEPHHHDDFRPSPFEPIEPNSFDDGKKDYDNNRGNHYGFFSFSFDDFLSAFWDFLTSFFMRYN